MISGKRIPEAFLAFFNFQSSISKEHHLDEVNTLFV